MSGKVSYKYSWLYLKWEESSASTSSLFNFIDQCQVMYKLYINYVWTVFKLYEHEVLFLVASLWQLQTVSSLITKCEESGRLPI